MTKLSESELGIILENDWREDKGFNSIRYRDELGNYGQIMYPDMREELEICAKALGFELAEKPGVWNLLYELRDLDPEDYKRGCENKEITPYMDRNQGFIYTEWGLMEVGHYGTVRAYCYPYLNTINETHTFKYTPLPTYSPFQYRLPLESESWEVWNGEGIYESMYEIIEREDFIKHKEQIQGMELAGD